MLTWAVAFLFLAIIAAVLGFLVDGPVGPILSAVFFAAFLWSLARERTRR